MTRTWHSLPAVALWLAAQAAVGAHITNSPHDFRRLGWGGDRFCVECHTPHEPEGRRYALYGRPGAADETEAWPRANSKLCLSCHDGAIGPDRSGVATGAALSQGVRDLDNTLVNHHPIDFVYDQASATARMPLFDPHAKTVTIGAGEQSKSGTIASVLLFDGKMQCLSCHDAHNTFTVGARRLLKTSTDGRTICLSCHKS